MREKKMKNNIFISENYRPSTNLQFDIGSIGLVEGFIPTSSTLDLLEFLLQPVLHKDASTIRSHLLVGAYGKGKSYTVLLAIELLKNNISKDVKNRFVSKVRQKRPYLADKIAAIGEKGSSRLLPVIVTGGFSSLSLALSSALFDSLEKSEIEGIILKSNFNKAINYIVNWKNQYINAYALLGELIKPYGFSCESIILALKNNDEVAINLFKTIFPKISNGSVFDNISEFEVIDDYKKVAKEIATFGYSGLYIVYDEFSKFLESTQNNMSEGDIKLLQDLAEVSNASSIKTQIHLTLISHKIPTSYFSDVKSINEWEAISGRFDVKDMFGSGPQEYEIIEGMLKSNESYVNQKLEIEKKEGLLGPFKNECLQRNLFNDNFDQYSKTCFPLHPISLYVLPRLSEKIAQNERSIFSFIVSKAPNSLASFIQHNKNGERLLLDVIYDYFLPLFRNAPKNSMIFKAFLMVDSVITNTAISPFAKRVTKSIAVLLILDDSHLPATFDSLKLAYGLTNYSLVDLEKANSELREKGVIRQAEGNGEYLPFVIDPLVHAQIKRNTNLEKKNLKLQNELTHLGFSLAYYPLRYNDENSINRYFKIELITEFSNLSEIEQKYRAQANKGDGVVFILLSLDQELINKVIEKSQLWKLCFLLIPKIEYDTERLIATLCEYKAITSKLLKKKNLQPNNESVLRYIANDDLQALNSMLEIFKNPQGSLLKCITKGVEYEYQSILDISRLCSDLYDEYIPHTVIFNREDINLEKPAEVSRKARDLVVDCLLNKNISKLRKYKSTSQQYSIYSSLCYNSNIVKEKEGSNEIFYDLNQSKNNFDKPILYLKSKILESTNHEIRFNDIINNLRNVDGGFGIKKGLIPFFLAIACSKYPNNLLVRNGLTEAEIGYKLFESVTDNPSNYTIQLTNWNANMEEYLSTLCNKFAINSLDFQVYEKLALALNNWFQLLPIQTRVLQGYFGDNGEIIQFSSRTRKILTVIRNSTDNPYSVIMEKLPSRIKKNYQYSQDLAELIIHSLEEIEKGYSKSVENIKLYFIHHICEKSVQDKNWIVSLHAWIDSLNDNNNIHYDINLSKKSKNILNLISSANNEEILFNNLTKTMIGLRFNDWSDTSIKLFDEAIGSLLNELSFADNFDVDDNKKMAQLSFIDAEGNEQTKKIALAEKNNISRMVSDEMQSIIEEMGSSLSREELNTIFMDFIVKN